MLHHKKALRKKCFFALSAIIFDRYTAQNDRNLKKTTKNCRKNLDKTVERI